MKYPKTIIDEASGVEVPNPKYEAYMDGMQEVVDWVESHGLFKYRKEDAWCDWQAFLKENELEE